MRRAAFLVAACIAGAAMAQNAADKKPEEKEKPPERPRLNLKLDNPSSFARTAPPEKEPEQGLPTLGGDARRLPPSGISTQNPTFPKDTSPTGH